MNNKLLAFLASALLLCSCLGGQQTGEQVVLRLGVMPSIDHLPLALAQELGYFGEEGLQVELIRFNAPMERDAALQTGELDGAISDYSTVILQHSKGLPIQLLSETLGLFYALSNKQDVRHISALKGQRWGLSSNTIIDYATDKVLSDAGINPSVEIERVEVQKIPLRLQMLLQGDLDVAILPEPFASAGLSKGLQRIASAEGEQGALPVQVTGLAIHRERSQGKDLSKLIRAYNKAINYLNTTAPEEWAELVARQMGVDLELSQAILKQGVGQEGNKFAFKPAQAPKPEQIEAVSTWLKNKGLLPEAYNAQEVLMPLEDKAK